MCNLVFVNLYSISPVDSSPLMAVLIILTGCVSFVATFILTGLILWLIVPTRMLVDLLGEKRAVLGDAFIARVVHARVRITMLFVYVMVVVIVIFITHLFFTL